MTPEIRSKRAVIEVSLKNMPRIIETKMITLPYGKYCPLGN